MKHDTLKTTSIEKALAILMEFTNTPHEMGTVELSQKLGYHSATVSRILHILKQKGFLQLNDRTRKFVLGPSAFELGRAVFRSLSGNLIHIAMPYLIDLREEVGETVVLETMSSRGPIVSYIAQGRRSLSVGPNIGDRVPFHVSPGAKAMAAFADQKTIDSILEREMQSFTAHTITDRKSLENQFKEIRQDGVAFCREEMAIGVNAIGAPIFNHDDQAIAAVVIAGLVSRVKCDINSPMVAALKRTAREISAQLFHQNSMEEIKALNNKG
ncbi:MAG: IclR family transcriptional regulator [Deltaproteobacteria bacterium]|nr:IclR family transcriptional regulator [Deltaproteobacteria bacterium]